VYAREIDGEEYTFGVSGKLIMNVLVMYDRQTGTYWSQLLGEAVEGPLVGTKLEYLPSWQTTWAEWRGQHPDTLAINKGTSSSADSYAGYYMSSQAGVIGETTRDDRLYVKEWVIGVDWNSEQVAYPYSHLNDAPVVNDTVGGTGWTQKPAPRGMAGTAWLPPGSWKGRPSRASKAPVRSGSDGRTGIQAPAFTAGRHFS
jgi:hypothetical protein